MSPDCTAGSTLEEMEKVSGGTKAEADAFLDEMAKKYNTDVPAVLLSMMTPEEIKHMQQLLRS